MNLPLIPLDLAGDPLRFVALCWPDARLYEKQQEVLLSVRDHVETFVPAANQTGKTWIAAVAALWFFLSRTPARVIVTSASESQLNSILWSEILHLVSGSRLPLPVVKTTLRLQKRQDAVSGQTELLDYLLGTVPRQVESFQGHHLPGDKPRVLAIFDEASGISDEYFDAADSWAHRKLLIGNPLSTTNFFYRYCRAGDQPDPAGNAKLLRKVIHVDGRDSPNVRLGMRWKAEQRPGRPPALIPGILSYDAFLRRERDWDVVKRTTRLYGEFYEGEQAMLFPASWLDAAMDRQRWKALERQGRSVEAIGVDVAAGGRDKTCWTLIDRFGVVEQITRDTPETMQIAGHTIRLIEQHRLWASRVVFDAGGGGKQIADRLREQGRHVLLVGFGESADAKQAYRNRRAELYGELRKLLDPAREDGVFALPPEAHELRRELAVLPLQYDSEGRQFLPPKDRRPGGVPGELSLRSLLGGCSPDRADSLALAAWALRRPSYAWSPDEPLICSGGPDDRPLTEEEVKNCPELLRWMIERGQQLDDDDDGRVRWPPAWPRWRRW